MAAKLPRKEIRRGFIQRTREARVRSGLSQEEIGDLLGVPQGTYKNYELNRPLPHEYVPEFCEICKIFPIELYGMATIARKWVRKAG